MNLSQMRDIDAADPIGTLGPRVTPAPTPAPAPVRRGDGFIVGPDGKLSTDLPDPTVTPAPAPTVYEFADALYESMQPHAGPVCAREPLKVGDRVRLGAWFEGRAGQIVTVTRVDAFGGADAYNEKHGAGLLFETEGKTWERVK